MSRVTNLIVVTSAFDRGLKQLNQWLVANEHRALNRVDQYAAGTRSFEAGVWMVACNYLNEPEFPAIVQRMPWDDAAGLFVKYPEDERFKEIALRPHEQTH